MRPKLPSHAPPALLLLVVAFATTGRAENQLCEASEDGHVELVKKLLTRDQAAEEATDDDRATALHCAARQGAVEVAQVLLEYQASPNARDEDQLSPLHEAAWHGHVDVARILLEHGATVDARERDRLTPLHEAAKHGHGKVAEELLFHGATINAHDKDGQSPVHWAAREGHVPVLQTLLQHGAPMNSRNKDNMTPLHWASKIGHVDVVAFLLDQNASSLNILDRWLWTPLFWAAYYNHTETVGELLRRNATVNLHDEWGDWTPLQMACYRGNVRVARELIRRGADVEAPGGMGFVALHVAASKGRIDVLKMLCEEMLVDVLVRSFDGKTAYDVAWNRHQREAATYLKDHGGDPGLHALLRHAITDSPWTFSCSMMLGLAAGILAGELVLRHPSRQLFAANGCSIHTSVLTEEQVALHEAPSDLAAPHGAWLLAAQTLARSGRWGSAKPLSRKLFFMSEVFMNMVLVFGPCMYHRNPLLILPLWLCLWVAPAAAHFGISKLSLNPGLVATNGQSALFRAFSGLRFLALLLAADVPSLFRHDVPVLEGAGNPHLAEMFQSQAEWQWMHWDSNASLNVTLLGATLVHYEGIPMREWFVFFEIVVVGISAASICALALDTFFQAVHWGPPMYEFSGADVEDLARQIVDAGKVELILRDCKSVKPLRWYPRPPFEMGLTLIVLLTFADMYLDCKVILELLARQHYMFCTAMLVIMTAKFVSEVSDGTLCNIRRDWQTSVQQGYMAEGLLTIVQREVGWEAFGQLAVTCYALPYLAQRPYPLIIAIVSMLSSVWNVAGHLFYLIDLLEFKEKIALAQKEEDSLQAGECDDSSDCSADSTNCSTGDLEKSQEPW